MPIYVFGCSQGHRSEVIRPVGTTENACPHCGEVCGRVYGYSMALTQPETDTRNLFRRFQEASSEIDYRAGQVESRTGQDVQNPNLWRAAKARAAAMTRAGENEARKTW